MIKRFKEESRVVTCRAARILFHIFFLVKDQMKLNNDLYTDIGFEHEVIKLVFYLVLKAILNLVCYLPIRI